jgi:hypothetical protein
MFAYDGILIAIAAISLLLTAAHVCLAWSGNRAMDRLYQLLRHNAEPSADR